MIKSVRKTLPQENMKLSFFYRIFWGEKKGETKSLGCTSEHIMNPSCTSTPVQTCISSSSTRSKKRGVNWWVCTSSFLRRLAIHQSSETAWKLRTHSIEHLLGSQTIIVNPLHIFTGTHLDMGNHVTPSRVYISYILESPLPCCYASKKQCLKFQSLSLKKLPSPCDPEWTTLEQLDANLIQDDALRIDWLIPLRCPSALAKLEFPGIVQHQAQGISRP